MRSTSKKIHVDRLSRALKSKGVDLKRSQIIEIAAQAFGHADSNLLAAADAKGELDIVEARNGTPYGRTFMWLLDPIAEASFAYESRPEANWSEGDCIASPYGNLLRVPKEVTQLQMPEMERIHLPSSFTRVRGLHHMPSRIVSETLTARERIVEPVRQEAIQKGLDESVRAYEQVGRPAQTIASLDKGHDASGLVGLEDHGLERFRDLTDIDTDLNPILTMTCHGLSMVDGRVCMTFKAFRDYESHHDATMSMEEMRELARKVAPRMEATRSTLRWTDDFVKGSIEIELHVPKPAFDHLRDAGQLEDAVLLLLGSPAASGSFAITEFVDQSPCRVGAVETPRRADGPVHVMVGEATFHPVFSSKSNLQTPDPFETEPVEGVDVEGNVYMQIGKGRDHSPFESRNPNEDVEGLERLSDLDDVFTGLHPMQVLEKTGASVIEGRAYLTFVANAEYEGPNELERLFDATTTLASGCEKAIVETGSILRWTEERRFGNLEIALHVPAAAIAHLETASQVQDAVLTLLGSESAEGRHIIRPIG